MQWVMDNYQPLTDMQGYQRALTAGENITIDPNTNVISALSMSSCDEIPGIVSAVSVPWSAVSSYKFLVFYGYKENISSPNQTCFTVIHHSLPSNGQVRFKLAARAGEGNTN